MSEEPLVLVEQRGYVQILTLNRPDAMNAFNMALSEALGEALDELDADPDVRVGVITGAGRGFSAGMDLKAFVEGGGIDAMPNPAGRGFGGIARAQRSQAAHCRGGAFSPWRVGWKVALSCDLIVASEGTMLGIPEVGVGLFAGAGALLRLPRQLPYGLAMEMALTAEPITAEVAHQHGMVNRVCPKGEAVNVAVELGERIARNAPKGVRASKALIRNVLGVSEDDFWAFQQPALEDVFASSDAIEGATAFAERRDPNWEDR